MSETEGSLPLQLEEVGNSDSATLPVHRMPELCVSDSNLPAGNSISLSPSLNLKEREVVALEAQSKALTSISNFLSGITLKDVLQHTAVHSAASALLGGLTSNDGRQALDARTMKQNAIDISYLLEAVLSKLSSHASSRSREVHDGEELQGFTKDK